jgi:hypothetical protein
MKKALLLMALLPFLSFGQNYFAEDFETTTDLATAGWTLYNDANTPQGGYATIITDAWNIVGWTAEAGNNTASTTSWFTPTATADRWMVTPAIVLPADANASMTFKIRSHDDGIYADGYALKVSTTGTAKGDLSTDLLVVDNAVNDLIANVATTTVDLSAYNGQTIYLAWVNTHTDGNLLSVDDISIDGGCGGVANLTFDAFTSSTADISWDNSGDFEIEYGEFPYTQGGGGTAATVTAGDTYTLSSLMEGTSYNVFIRQNCGGGDFGGWSEVVVGTIINPITSFPYSEGFEPAANQALLLNLGIGFAGAGAWVFGGDDLTDGDTTNDFAYDGVNYFFSNNTSATTDADAWLYIGPFNLETAQEYTFSFQQKNFAASSATRPNKDLEVSVATTNDNTTDTVILTLDDLDNIDYVQRDATHQPATTGNYYFGIHDKSSFLAAATEANSVIIDALSISSTLSLEDFSKISTAIYPNPTVREFTIDFSDFNDTSNIAISVSDLNGRLVKQFKVQDSYNVSDLSAGTYILKITDGSSYFVQKLVKK